MKFANNELHQGNFYIEKMYQNGKTYGFDVLKLDELEKIFQSGGDARFTPDLIAKLKDEKHTLLKTLVEPKHQGKWLVFVLFKWRSTFCFSF